MAETKFYEEGGFRIELTPQGDPHRGTLMTRFPEMDPYAAEVDLSKKRSRSEYANDAAEVWGVEEGSELAKDLKRALNAVHVTRLEEVAAAQKAEQEEVEPAEVHPEVSEEEIAELVGEPGVLDRFVEDAAKIHGVVREREPLKLLTLNAFGAQLEPLPNGKPLGANVVLTAEWGRGKNHLCDAVAALLPEGFYLAFESASAKSLYYRAEEDSKILAHRWLYLNEAEAMDQLVEMLRPLLSGGRASHLTVNQVDGQNAAQELRVEGPVTITIPTIRNKLDAQLQSRLLTADLPDYEGRVAGHSRAASKLLLPGYASEDYSPRTRAWQAALGSLTALRRVVFPLDEEGFCFDRDDVSHGARLWTNVLGLMSAHAMLEQRNREAMTLSNGERAIVATPADYEAAYNLFKATCERSVQNLSDAHRKILNGLYELTTKDKQRHWMEQERGWSQRAIERHTGVPQSTISAQKSFLTKSLKLVIEDVKGRLRLAEDVDSSLWETDDALDGFPRPRQVWAWWNGDDDPPDPERPGPTDQGHEASERRGGSGGEDGRGYSPGRPEASVHPAQDEAGHHADQSEEDGDHHAPSRENAPNKQESTSKGEPSGLTSGLGDHRQEVSEEDEGPQRADGDDHGWRARYLRDMEERLGVGWENEPPGTLLDKLGWAHYEGLPTIDDANPEDPWAEDPWAEDPWVEDKWKLKRDPLVRTILDNVCIYDSDFGRSTWVATDAELSALQSEHEDEEGLYAMGQGPDLREARERLLEMLPTLLQAKWRFYDPDEDFQSGGVGYAHSEGFLYVERWERESEEEGIWYFVALKGGQHIPREEVEADVWMAVRYIEELTESHYSPQFDVFEFDD